MRIYTKTGDDGTTGLIGGSRARKTDARIEAIGDVDELNSAIGFALCSELPEEVTLTLSWCQNVLFEVGAELGTVGNSREALSSADVAVLESSIDALSEALPQLRSFILPGGSEASARLHMARAICRRAERSVLKFHAIEPARDVTLQFLNRLSDWLFVAARTANRFAGVEDVSWIARDRSTNP